MDGDVQKFYLVIGFWFCRELHVSVECIKVILYVYDVSAAGVKDYQNVIYISEVCRNVFIEEWFKVCVFEVLKKELCY
jgi:hypothetical protein